MLKNGKILIALQIQRKEVEAGKTKELTNIAVWLAELQVLQRNVRMGERFGKGFNTTASHSFETTVIAQVLGEMAKKKSPEINLDRLEKMALFPDINETRLAEKDKVAAYYEKKNPEICEKAVKDRLAVLPEELAQEIFESYWEANFGQSKKAKLIKDANELADGLYQKLSGAPDTSGKESSRRKDFSLKKGRN